MPKIAKIEVRDNEVWCRVELTNNTDVLGPITLWSEREIKRHDEQALCAFAQHLVDEYLAKMRGDVE